MIRGIYEWGDGWDVPKFADKAACQAWVDEHRLDSTNPDYPHLHHVITLCVTWPQVAAMVLQPAEWDSCDECRRRHLPALDGGTCTVPRAPAATRFPPDSAVIRAAAWRLALPFHTRVPVPRATTTTARYLFHHMRSCIYVKYRAGRLRVFAPFANRDYTNTVCCDARVLLGMI